MSEIFIADHRAQQFPLKGAGMERSPHRPSSRQLDVPSVRQFFVEKVACFPAGKISWQLRKNLILQPQEKKDKNPEPQAGLRLPEREKVQVNT